MCRIGTGVGLSLLEELDTNNSVSELILFNHLLYDLHFFISESVYLEKNFSSKMACIECKMIFSCI